MPTSWCDQRIDELKKAIRQLLEDYRTEGCPDPNCSVCKRSKVAETFARQALEGTNVY